MLLEVGTRIKVITARLRKFRMDKESGLLIHMYGEGGPDDYPLHIKLGSMGVITYVRNLFDGDSCIGVDWDDGSSCFIEISLFNVRRLNVLEELARLADG